MDAASSYRGGDALCALVCLRGLVMHCTQTSPRASGLKMKVLMVSGTADDVYILPLVKRCAKRLGREDVLHKVVEGLNHDDENEQEISTAVRFVAACARLPRDGMVPIPPVHALSGFGQSGGEGTREGWEDVS